MPTALDFDFDAEEWGPVTDLTVDWIEDDLELTPVGEITVLSEPTQPGETAKPDQASFCSQSR